MLRILVDDTEKRTERTVLEIGRYQHCFLQIFILIISQEKKESQRERAELS